MQDLAVPAAAAQPSPSQCNHTTVSRSLLDFSKTPDGQQGQFSDVCHFYELWQKAIAEEVISECTLTTEIRELALRQFQH